MSILIDPNDSTVQALKSLVKEYDGKLDAVVKEMNLALDELHKEVLQAFKMAAEGNQVMFTQLLVRLSNLEQRVHKPSDTLVLPEQDSGKEL